MDSFQNVYKNELKYVKKIPNKHNQKKDNTYSKKPTI